MTRHPMALPVAVLAALLLAACAGLTQTPPPGLSNPSSPPTFKVGETWTYAVHDGYTKLPFGTETHRVVEANDTGYAVELTPAGASAPETRRLTRDLRWIVHPLPNRPLHQFDPPSLWLPFPLEPGWQWSETTQARVATGETRRVMTKGEVLGWERVTVPAGTFDTIKVHRQVWGRDADYDRYESMLEENFWYAPAANHVVRADGRSEYRSKTRTMDRGAPLLLREDWKVYKLLPPGASRP